jgi:hypothetical protein
MSDKPTTDWPPEVKAALEQAMPKIPAGNGSVFTSPAGTRYRLANVNARRQTATLIRAQSKDEERAERKAARKARRRQP